jgi:hypothetical protein
MYVLCDIKSSNLMMLFYIRYYHSTGIKLKKKSIFSYHSALWKFLTNEWLSLDHSGAWGPSLWWLCLLLGSWGKPNLTAVAGDFHSLLPSH